MPIFVRIKMLKQNSNVMQIFIFLLSALILQLETSSFVFALNNGLARTPPMGWLAWERFKCDIDCSKNMEHCISERLFMQMADRLVADGFRDAGYVYVNIDDCWMAPKRDTQGKLVADPKRFPRGIKFLADYMHSRGLKLGIYQDYGKYTCMGYPGIIGHMEQDANSFAEWEVDMVKLDACHSDPKDLDEGYVTMGRYLNQTKRPMVYSCSWPYYQLVNGMEPNYKLIAKYCNLWRNFDDIQDSWLSIQKTIDFFGDNQEVLIPHVGPGQWSDPDMLVFGNFLLTYDQARIQMAVWAMIAAPLLMSNDLRTLAPKFRNILLNRHIIAVNQDPIGIPGRRIYKKDGIEVWKRPITPVLKNQRSYVLLFLSRRSASKPVFVTFQLKQFSLKNPSGYFLTELFSGDNYGAVTTNQSIKIELSAIDLVMLKAKILNLHEHQNFINIK